MRILVFGDGMNWIFPVCGFMDGAGVFFGIFQPLLGWFGFIKMLRCVLLLVPGAIIPQLHDQHFRGLVSSGIPFPIRKTVKTATSTLRICYKLQRKIKSSHEIQSFFSLGAERQTPPREYGNGESSGFDAPICRIGKKTMVLCICNLLRLVFRWDR
jgi:hypothetical protein